MLLRFALALLFTTSSALLTAAPWIPMTAEEAAQTASRIDPGAGAEIISRRVTIDDGDGLFAEYKYQLRVKIFNAKGVEDFLSHKIEYDSTTSVSGIEARVYKPNGTTLALEKKSILDQQVVRSDSTRIRAKVAALPGLEPGCVVELRWTEEHENISIIRMAFQDKHPTRLVHYDFYAYSALGLESVSVNYRGPAPKLDSRGRFQLEMTDVKAYKEEPFDLPAVQAKSWLVAWYTSDDSATPEDFWTNFCRKLDTQLHERTKPRKDITEKAKTLVEGATTEDAKLRRLYEFCIAQIKNPYFVSSGYTAEQRKKLKKDQSPSDTLKSGYGWHDDINHLFISLARSLGIDARLARAGDRESFIPSLNRRHAILLRHPVVAIRQDPAWLFLDPGSIWIPYGMLPPDNEGVAALISDPKKAIHATTPMMPPDASLKKRTANLTLSPDGDLTGTVTVNYTGLRAYELKYDLEDDTVEQQQDYIRSEVTEFLPLAEVTDISVRGAASPTQPLTVSYKLRIPQYADRTGQRLLFQPAVFQKGRPAYFTAETRENKISFRRNQTTYDDIRFELPPGFDIEEGTAPTPLLDLDAIGKYRTQIGVPKGGMGIVYRREFTQRFVIVPPQHYGPVKKIFDVLHTQDNHTLSLLQRPEKEPASLPPSPAASAPVTSAPAAPASVTSAPVTPSPATPAPPTAANTASRTP